MTPAYCIKPPTGGFFRLKEIDMWTLTYKNFDIHGWPGSNVVYVTYPGVPLPQYFKSLLAAKWRITRYLNTQE